MGPDAPATRPRSPPCATTPRHSHPLPRRAALSLLTAAVAAPPPPPAVAAPTAFCGALDVLPPWTYTLPWTEGALPAGADGGPPLWTRVVGDRGGGGLLARFKKQEPAKLPILVVPGEPGTPCTYLESLELLAGDGIGRVVAFFDPPGVGRSTPRDGTAPPLSATATPAALQAAMARVADGVWPGNDGTAPSFHVVAHGVGGLAALDALAADPRLAARAASLTLLSTPPSVQAGVSGRVARARQVLGDGAAASLVAGPADPAFADAAAAFFGAAVCKRPAGCVAAARGGADPAIAAALAGPNPLFAVGGALAGWAPRLPARPPPVLLITGGDGAVAPADAAALAAAVGGAVRTVPAAGDYVFVDAAAEVVDAVARFVGGVDGGV